MNADRAGAVLRVGDLDHFLELDFSEEDLFKFLQLLPDSKVFKYEKYFNRDPHFELFVAFSGKDPRYSLGIGRWRQMPYFSLLDFRNMQSDHRYLRGDRKLLDALFTRAFETMHQEGRFSFFYATRVRPFPIRHLRANGEVAPVRGVPVFDRYDFTIEAEIPVGAEPQYPYQQSLVRLNDRAFDYWLKRGTLKLAHLVKYLPSFSK